MSDRHSQGTVCAYPTFLPAITEKLLLPDVNILRGLSVKRRGWNRFRDEKHVIINMILKIIDMPKIQNQIAPVGRKFIVKIVSYVW
ncbi:hypothetical protein AA073_17320 [Salmonella enterica subsp. enterica serovar Newport]|nr:hypothetical protein [Salmonella enterica subsp. enterica serovar Newport]